QLRTFYIMENKVTNQLFGTAANDPEFMNRLAEIRRKHPWGISEQWNQGPGSKEPNWGTRPVQRVTVTEASLFAEWLGGKLPTASQWDKAHDLLAGEMNSAGLEWTRNLAEGTGAPVSGENIEPRD